MTTFILQKDTRSDVPQGTELKSCAAGVSLSLGASDPCSPHPPTHPPTHVTVYAAVLHPLPAPARKTQGNSRSDLSDPPRVVSLAPRLAWCVYPLSFPPAPPSRGFSPPPRAEAPRPHHRRARERGLSQRRCATV